MMKLITGIVGGVVAGNIALAQPTAVAAAKPAGEMCARDSECESGACARPSASKGEVLQCCSGDKHLYAGYYYCKGMLDGSTCWSDAMCGSRSYCAGNKSGFGRGVCTAYALLNPGDSCTTDKECPYACKSSKYSNNGFVCCTSSGTMSQETCAANAGCAFHTVCKEK